jgi:bifunctional non-homologous end joining protein LigD
VVEAEDEAAQAPHHEGKLVYVGGVGTGWTEKERRRLRGMLDPLERETTPFHVWTGLEKSFARGKPEKIVWVEPKLVARCHYQEFTDDGKVIRCSFLGLEERDPASCTWLADAPLPESERPLEQRETRLPKLTNGKKVFFPETGTTKGDLFRYYEKVAPVLLPHLRDRPMTLRRLPDGIHGFDFYQKNQGKAAPEWLRTVTVRSQESGRNVRYAIVDDLGGLLYCIQLGCISLSPWSSRLGSLDNPDWSIVDLDPGPECPFDRVIEVARLVREILEELGLRGYPKTSGATGIHVMVPLEPVYTYEHSRLVAEIVATIVTERHPQLCTVARAVKDRPPDRVYVDFLQNARGKHVVAPYSVREVPSAAVSAPVRWDELRPRVRPEDFTIANEEERLRRVGDLFRPVLEDRQSLEKALARRGVRNDRRR